MMKNKIKIKNNLKKIVCFIAFASLFSLIQTYEANAYSVGDRCSSNTNATCQKDTGGWFITGGGCPSGFQTAAGMTSSFDNCGSGLVCCIKDEDIKNDSFNTPQDTSVYQKNGGAGGTTSYQNQELIPGAGQTGDIVEYIKQIIRFGFAAIGILALFMISIGAYQYLMAAGNLAKAESAKETIGSALLGLVLGLTAFLILRTINPQLINLQLTSPGGGAGVTSSSSGTTSGGTIPKYTGAAPEEIKVKVKEYANKYGISEDIALALVNAESNFNPRATSPKGAMGLMQLMPGTASGLTDPYDIDQNLNGGMKYLKQMYERYNGNWEMALAAYNWGSGNLDSKGYENRPKETQDFVCKILKNC